jgi:hypothetical protein
MDGVSMDVIIAGVPSQSDFILAAFGPAANATFSRPEATLAESGTCQQKTNPEPLSARVASGPGVDVHAIQFKIKIFILSFIF